MKRATQEPVLPLTDGRKRVARETLRSGRQVHIDRIDTTQEGEDRVVVRVGGDAGWATVTLPVRSWMGFGRPLAVRIREAIIKLDHPIETEVQDIVIQAVDTALFHGGPLQEGSRTSRQEPPLIASDPPAPPPADMR